MKNIYFFLFLLLCKSTFSSDYEPGTEPSLARDQAEMTEQELNNSLAYAVEHDLSDQIKPLVEKGANINCKNLNDDNFLIYSFENHRSFETKLALLQANINVDHKNQDGKSALDFAMHDPKIFKHVLKKTNFNKIGRKNQINKFLDAFGNNILTKSIDYRLATSEYVRLLNTGININHQNQFGKSAISKAIELKNIKLIKLLLWFGASVDLNLHDQLEALITEQPTITHSLAKLLKAITPNFIKLYRSKELKDQALLSLFLTNEDLFADLIADPKLPESIKNRLSECFQSSYLDEMELKFMYKTTGKDPQLVEKYQQITTDLKRKREQAKRTRTQPTPGVTPVSLTFNLD